MDTRTAPRTIPSDRGEAAPCSVIGTRAQRRRGTKCCDSRLRACSACRSRDLRLMFGWLRKRAAARPIPDELWDAVLERYAFLAARPPAQQQSLRELAAQFLATKEFHGANGMVITDKVALAIAAQAVLPVLNLGLAWYDDFVGI